jgi:chitin synthase
MLQVYEYYISHHLTKAFESLFGSVTCLPGCFSVYRIRTADKGRPVIISSIVIDEYAEPNVDTLHKKNLFSLGEDRYLTTLMMKHFPTFKMKFTPDAIAHTVAPSRWNVLLSQRRRWINSTVHNLAELLFLPEMCGFCFFSMRFIVFIDLLGTIVSVSGLFAISFTVSALTASQILPATCGYVSRRATYHLQSGGRTGPAPLTSRSSSTSLSSFPPERQRSPSYLSS